MHTKIQDDKAILDLCKTIRSLKDDDYEQCHIDPNLDLNYYSHLTKGCLPIHYAAQLGKSNILKLLIDNGANPHLGLQIIDPKTTFINFGELDLF